MLWVTERNGGSQLCGMEKWAVRSSQQHKLMEGPNLVMQSVCSTLSCAPQKKADLALSFSLPGVHI